MSASLPSPSDTDIIPDPEDFHRRNLLLYNLTGTLDDLIARLCRRTPNPMRRGVSVTTFMIISLLVTLFLLLTGGGFQSTTIVTVWLQLYLGFFTFVTLLAPELINRKVVAFLVSNEEKWARTHAFMANMSEGIRLQWLAGLVVVGVAVPTFAFIFRLGYGYYPGWSLLAVVGLLGFLWGLGGYIAIFTSIRFTSSLNTEGVHLYAFDPRRSPIIDKLSNVFEFSLAASSLSLVFFILPLLILNILIFVVVAVGLLAGGFVVLIALFLFAQIQLGELVSQRRRQVTNDLQKQIEALYNRSEHLQKSEFEEMQALMKLHEGLVGSVGWNLGTTRLIYYLRSFVLPTVLAIINLGLLRDPQFQKVIMTFIDSLEKMLNAP